LGKLIVSGDVRRSLVSAGAVFWPVQAMIVFDTDLDWDWTHGCAEAVLLEHLEERDIGEPEELVEPYGLGVWPKVDWDIMRSRGGQVVERPDLWFVDAGAAWHRRENGGRGVFAGPWQSDRNLHVSEEVRGILEKWDSGGSLLFEEAPGCC
jgi:hypothetical protein